MICETIDIRVEGVQEQAALHTYILNAAPNFASNERPLILVCPGGGYGHVSDREGEIIAMQFCAMGYHAAVLKYSVAPARFPTACLQVGKAVLELRKRAKEWHIIPDKIAVIGFSAGGHLAASYSVFWNRGWMAEALGTDAAELKPNGLILGYPVITSGEYAHQGSFLALLGDRYEELKEELSLENQVSAAVPETFLWHTFEDSLVPVQNSMLFAQALAKNGISVEYHVFAKGGHGLSLANEVTRSASGFGVEPTCQCWIELLGRWLNDWKQK